MDTAQTATVAAVLKGSGYTVKVVPGCTQKHGGSEPYMCDEYNSTAVKEAIVGADLVIVAVGLGSNVESEGRDREKAGLALPGFQNALVHDALDSAQSQGIPSVALVFAAGPVDPSLFGKAGALIDCFYPAEAAGFAVHDVLFGHVIPAARLPFSWPTTATE